MTSRAERTRAALQAHALALFTERGFDATTVQDIAAAAGVSHMTFFRHFTTKESVLLEDPYDPLLARVVEAQPTMLAPLERVRRGLLDAWAAAPEPTDAETRARVRLVAGHPGLRAKAWENNQRTAEAIVEVLTRQGVDPLAAKVATGACLGALTAALLDWGEGQGGEPLGARIVAALEMLALDGQVRA